MPETFTDLKVRGLSEELLADLDRLFPERCPEQTMTERSIWIAAGKRQLVRFLHQQLKAAQHASHTHQLSL